MIVELKEGDMLTCKEDFVCKNNSTFYCKKGDKVKVSILERSSHIHNNITAFCIRNKTTDTWVVVEWLDMLIKYCDGAGYYSTYGEVFINLNKVRSKAKKIMLLKC